MALRRRMKNFVKNYSEAEIKVREATSNDPWGPSSSLMLEISDLTYNRVSVFEIMNMIWHRMNDYGKNWRHVYKSLTLLDYLLKNGSKKVIQHCQEGSYNIQILKDFHHIDEAGKDQGFYVREKAKQVIALLTDEQQLHNEREIACRTRQRTSYAMLLPTKTSGKSSSAIPASDPISEFPPSENIQYFSIKALPAAEQSQTDQMSGNAEMACETVASNIITKSSPEDHKTIKTDTSDLIDLSKDEPPTFAVQSTFPTRVFKEELATDKKAATSTSRKAKTALTSYGRLPAPKWDSSKKSKSSVVSGVTLKVPPKEGTGANKVTETNKHFTKPAVISCSSEPSVETIYRSPTLQAFYPLGNNTVNTTESTPASSMHFCGHCTSSLQTLDFSVQGTAQTAGLSSHPSRRPGSDSSVGTTSSFYTFSLSSPESMSPNNTAQTHHISSHGSSYVSSPHGRPSLFFKDLKERIAHFFSWVPDVDENETTSILSLLPGNSKCSIKKKNRFRCRTSLASGGRLVTSLMHNIPSVSNPGLPSAANLPSADYVSSEQKSIATLEEIKNAVCGLRADFCSAAQDLHIIRGELTNVMISMQKMTPPQTYEGASGQK